MSWNFENDLTATREIDDAPEPKSMNQVQVVERDTGTEIQTQSASTSPMRLVELAISKNADIDKLERLMQMQERWESREAEKSFNRAMADFQNKCPRIVKRKEGHGYKYATLGDIQAQIKMTANECGISWRWETVSNDGNSLTVRCIVTHIDGHSQSTDSTSFIENPNKMQTRTQMIGVATTYAQRYSLIGALGISTADEDMDARLPGEYQDKPKYTSFNADKEAILNAIKNGSTPDSIIEQLEENFKVSDPIKKAIGELC